MSIQAVRPNGAQKFQGGQLARVLPLTRFGAAYDKPVEVRLDTTGVFDMFQPAASRQARIHLVPKTEEHLDALKKKAETSSNPIQSLRQLLDQLLKITRKEADPVAEAANKFVYVDLASDDAAEGDTKTPEERKLETARKNTDALLKAYDAELDKLSDKLTEVTAVLPDTLPEGVDRYQMVREMAKLAVLKGYNYRFHRSDNENPTTLGSVTVHKPIVARRKDQTLADEAPELAWVADQLRPEIEADLNQAIAEGKALGRAMNLTRHLVDSPANFKTTRYVADQALALKDANLDVQVLEGDDLLGKTAKNDKKMGLFLSVAQGNDDDNPDKAPRLVEMTYTPPGFDPATGKTVLLVGKGIIFDTGGYDLKSFEYQHNMRGDMAGAAAVLGTMKMLKEQPLENVRVVGLMPLTENRISHKASLNQDIYTARSGKKAEISSTDAEGRLVLSDAMHYGLEKYKGQLNAAFTIATLTGAKTMLVGEHNAVGISGNNEPFLKELETILKGSARRETAVVALNEKHQAMVRQGQADVRNYSDRKAQVAAGLLEKDALDKKYAEEHKETLNKKVGANGMADGAAFIRAVAWDPDTPEARAKGGPVIDPTVPWGHFDIAGAEFNPRDERRDHHEWASGIGVEDLYYSLKAIAKGRIQPDPAKTLVLGKK